MAATPGGRAFVGQFGIDATADLSQAINASDMPRGKTSRVVRDPVSRYFFQAQHLAAIADVGFALAVAQGHFHHQVVPARAKFQRTRPARRGQAQR